MKAQGLGFQGLGLGFAQASGELRAQGFDGEFGGLGLREALNTFEGLLPESQGQNLALTVLCVPYSLDSGSDAA